MACAVSLRPHRKAEREPRPAEGRKDIATPPRSGLCPTRPASSRAAHLISAYLRAREDGPRGASRQGATGSQVPKRGASPQGWPPRPPTPRGDGLAGPQTGCEPAGMAPEGPHAKERRARGPQNGVRARRNGHRGVPRQGVTGSRAPKRGASQRRWPPRGLAPRGDGLAGPKTGCEPAEMATEGPHAKKRRARGPKTGCEPAGMAPEGPRAKE